MITLFLVTCFGLMLVAGAPMLLSMMSSGMVLPLLFGSSSPVQISALFESFVRTIADANTALTIGLFMVAGEIMSRGKLTDKIFNTFTYYLGKKRGFMPILCLLTCMFYGAISGSGPATTAAVGGMCYPLLVAFGYDKVFSAAMLTCGGCLGMVIPPSIPLTLASLFAGSVGVEAELNPLYMIAAVVGVFAGIVLIVYTYLYCLKNGNGDQAAINNHVDELRKRPFGEVFKEGIWALLTPVLILGSIFTGIADTCQTATFALFYGLFVSVFIYKTIRPGEIFTVLKDALVRNLPVLIMLGAAGGIFGSTLSALEIPTKVSTAMISTGVGKTGIIIMILLFMLISGTFMDSGTSSQILIPMVAPMLQMMGIDIYTCFVSLIVAQAIGQTTPPYGLSMFIMCGAAGCSVAEISKKLWPLILLLVVIAFIPALAPFLFTWALPS